MGLEGEDHFRLPKELVMIATAIVTAAMTAAGLLLGKIELTSELRERLKIPAVLCAAGFAWTLLAAIASTNRALSIDALIWVAAFGALFLIGCTTFRVVPMHWITIALFAPALINAVLVIVQATGLWNPWVFEPNADPRAMRNALLGNPNYVGAYLAAPLLFAATEAIHGRRRLRLLYGVTALLLAAGVLVTLTLSALGSLAVAFAVLGIRWHRRRGIAVVVATMIVLVVASFAYAPMRTRISIIANLIEEGQWGRIVSGRIFPSYTALQMFEDHPLLGVGPGAFKFNYMPYAIETADRNPRLAEMSGTQTVNFGEVHNDHLQVLAETGLPGYLIVLALILSIARGSRGPKPEDDDRARLAHGLALPFVVLLMVVMLAQFVLQLAATAVAFAVIAAVCIAWRRDVVA